MQQQYRKKEGEETRKQHSRAFGSPPHGDRWSAAVVIAARGGRGFPSVRVWVATGGRGPPTGGHAWTRSNRILAAPFPLLSLSTFACFAHASLGLSHRPQRSFHVPWTLRVHVFACIRILLNSIVFVMRWMTDTMSSSKGDFSSFYQGVIDCWVLASVGSENKQLVARVLYPGVILHMWSVVVGYPTKIKIWLIFLSLYISGHLQLDSTWRSELPTPYKANFACLSYFGSFQRPLLGLFPHGKANRKSMYGGCLTIWHVSFF